MCGGGGYSNPKSIDTKCVVMFKCNLYTYVLHIDISSIRGQIR